MAELLGDALFAESQTDFAVYHDIPLYGMYGGRLATVGRARARRAPSRPGRAVRRDLARTTGPDRRGRPA